METSTCRERAMLVEAALLFCSSERDEKQYLGDEATLAVLHVKGKDENGVLYSTYCKPVDPYGHRAHRSLVRIFLSGSLEKHRHTPVSRSFFHSRLREVHLVPFVASFLVKKEMHHKTRDPVSDTKRNEEEEEGNEEEKAENGPSSGISTTIVDVDRPRGIIHSSPSQGTTITSLEEVAFYLFRNKGGRPSRFPGLHVTPRSDNDLVGYIPLLYHTRKVKHLSISSQSPKSADTFPIVNLSCLEALSGSNLKELYLMEVFIPSLSPLSKCHLPVLETLHFCIGSFGPCRGFSSLEGLTNENTQSLQSLMISCSDLVDISTLSTLNLSSLNTLILFSRSLSDISPLQHCHLSSLTQLDLRRTAVSDLSPLHRDNVPSLKHLNLDSSLVSDLSPLQSLNPLVKLKLMNTRVVDLSPLSLCDLSSLTELRCDRSKIRDLSPLSHSDLSSLSSLFMNNCGVLDISPLGTAIGFSPKVMDFSDCPIDDLSPLSHIQFQNVVNVHLCDSLVEDLSPLSNISVEMHLNVRGTPIAEELFYDESLPSPLRLPSNSNVTIYYI